MTLKKISNRGKYVRSDEWKKRLSERICGKNNPMYGREPWNKGIPRTEEEKRKMSDNRKGKSLGHTSWNKDKTDVYSEETRKKWSESRKGVGNSNFGNLHDDVGYAGLHDYIRKYKPRPLNGLCQMCLERPYYDVACVNGRYTRDLWNWAWWCRSCHKKYDGRNGYKKHGIKKSV